MRVDSLSKSKKSQYGGIALESVLVLPAMLFLCLLYWESARRGLYEVHARWGCFELARESFVHSPAKVEREVRKRLRSRMHSLQKESLQTDVEVYSRSLRGRVFFEFASLLRFPWQSFSKHHFEMARRCSFSFR